jgi:hypothetical protein
MCFGMKSVFSAAPDRFARLRRGWGACVHRVLKRCWASIGQMISQDAAKL